MQATDRFRLFLIMCCACSTSVLAQAPSNADKRPAASWTFDGHLDAAATRSVATTPNGESMFVRGLDGEALRLRTTSSATTLTIDDGGLTAGPDQAFSVQCWVRTTAANDRRMVLLSHKHHPDNSLRSQKAPGWAFYLSGGTWAWTLGAGKRRITYERDNGSRMPLNDGRWHQLTMTYDAALGQVWLYYDGRNRAIYSVRDTTGFDFTCKQPLTVGWTGTSPAPKPEVVDAIRDGADLLQQLVDAFDALGLPKVQPDEFVRLIVEPKRLFGDKLRTHAETLGADATAFVAAMESADFAPVSRIESQLMRNPYTVHQAFTFLEAAPLLKIYSLVDGKVAIDERAAKAASDRERLHPSDFDLDELKIWPHALTPAEVAASYARHFEPTSPPQPERCTSLTTGVWNIFHGGKHFTVDEHGWDSRVAIAQIVEREEIDVLMMQETYSSGDFIAAELGYHFATTVDWDYLNQGSNISVLSRFPIQEVRVPPNSSFMNVAARVAISSIQDVWVMSNWYGMNEFANVRKFHQPRFDACETTPVLFGGDFNAVPHTDGGNSPASKAMLAAGFTDAFRSMHPDIAQHPGHSHRSGSRIDQLYFKGGSLAHRSTSILKSWPTGFPSDHYLIRSTFDLR